MRLTRTNLVAAALKRPLWKLRWQDIRGTMSDFSRADIVFVSDEGKTRIMKDRQGDYR